MRAVRGFSFVEVMTVIALMSIMMAVTFVLFSGKRSEAALNVMAREVASAVRVAQNNALSGVKDQGNDNGLCFHSVRAVGVNSYEASVRHLKSGRTHSDCQNFPSDTTESLLSSYLLTDGVTFLSPMWDISFGVPLGEVIGGASQSILLQKGGKYSAVCILASGVVIEKPASSSVPSCL